MKCKIKCIYRHGRRFIAPFFCNIGLEGAALRNEKIRKSKRKSKRKEQEQEEGEGL